jgi:Gpi18-like mannosyltransferase
MVAGVVIAAVVRLVLLPSEGLRGDIDQFVQWVHHITTNGLGRAYDGGLSFGPVMTLIWGMLGAVEPAFQDVTDASDPAIRVLMKLPATLADFGLAAAVGFALRDRPIWAVAGAVAVLLHPATWYVSAWWGQYESIYTLAAVVAVLGAISGRNAIAAAALTVAVLTKPQAIPFVLPFAAWFLARGGPQGLARAGLAAVATAAVLWLPFLAAGGPLSYLDNLREYQDGIFSVLSLRAWNLWWLVQEVGANGQFVSDRSPIAGPLTFRIAGFALTGLFSLYIAARIYREATPRALILGLAAATLVAFTFLTTMHERYAYAALAFLVLLLPERRIRWLGVAFGLVFTLNLVAAVPATTDLGNALPAHGGLGIAASLAFIGLTAVVLLELAGTQGRNSIVTGPTDPISATARLPHTGSSGRTAVR